jgi:hypothetical protein
MARACFMGRACWPVSHELLLTTDGGGETSSAAEAEQWLGRLGRALLTAQTTSKALQAFDAAGVPARRVRADTIDCVHSRARTARRVRAVGERQVAEMKEGSKSMDDNEIRRSLSDEAAPEPRTEAGSCDHGRAPA